MAPEQIHRTEGRWPGPIFMQSASMLFEMIVPELPLPIADSAMALVRQKIELKGGFFQELPSQLNHVLRKEIDTIVNKATAYNPDHRYESCREFVKSLQSYEDNYVK